MVKIDNFAIDSDSRQFIIKEFIKVKDVTSVNYGSITTFIHGYFCSFEGALIALEKILTRRVINNMDYTLKEAVEAINLMHTEIIKKVEENEKCQI